MTDDVPWDDPADHSGTRILDILTIDPCGEATGKRDPIEDAGSMSGPFR